MSLSELLHIGLLSFLAKGFFWALLLGVSSIGLGQVVSTDRKKHWIDALSSGTAIMGLSFAWTLSFGLYVSEVMIFIFIIGLITGVKKCTLLCKGSLNNIRKIRTLAIWPTSLLLLAWFGNFIRMSSPSGGQESFQYHYFLPLLYTEQETLFLEGYELYDALLNVWGMEALLSLSQHLGGLHAMGMHLWFLSILFCLQIYRSSQIFFKNRTISLTTTLLTQICTIYICFLWWSKPELILTGYFALIVSKLHQEKNKLSSIEFSILIAWALSLKMTSIIIAPILIGLIFYHKINSKRLLQTVIAVVFWMTPWTIFLLNHEGGIGALPSGNPDHFVAPNSTIQLPDYHNLKLYFKNLIFYAGLFKPGIFLFLIGLPIFLFKFKHHGYLCIGLFFNLFIAILMLIRAPMYYADEFRYACFTLIVIPIGAGYTLKYLSSKYTVILPLTCVALSLITYRRVDIAASEAWRYHSGYMKGEKPLYTSLSKEGGVHFQHYLEQRTPKDKLLHIGHGNYATAAPHVIHVGSWSKRYPIWKYQNKEEFLTYCKKLDVQWVLYEKSRYSVYGRGLGGPEYFDTSLSKYYREVQSAMDNLNEFAVKDLSPLYILYHLDHL